MYNVSILGAGTWGCALAILLAGNGRNVTIWTKLEAEARMLEENRGSMKNLPGARMPEEVKVTLDLEEACKDRDLIVMAVASPYIRSTSRLASPFINERQVIVNVSKGIEDKTLHTLSDRKSVV
jgi:glycerol-3-phosphate dehydrogenase (NAD(P)+)